MIDTPHILLAEDDHTLGYVLTEYLKMSGFRVKLAANGEEAYQCFENEKFDLAILDIMMPVMDGFTVAKKIKQNQPSFPIIFLTAKSLKVDKLKGFNLGADDYIIKPVDEEELVARIKAVWNRAAPHNSDFNRPPKIFHIGRYRFEPQNRLLEINDKDRILTERETEILTMLCQFKGTILDRKKVLKTCWGSTDYFSRKSMDVFIYKLRKYLANDETVSIKNVHGKGFILEVDGEVI